VLTFDAAAFADDWSPPAGGGTLSGWYYRWATQGCVSRFFFCAREPGTAIEVRVGLYPIVTFQYSSTTLYHFPYNIQ
jgi:hypothetical protein